MNAKADVHGEQIHVGVAYKTLRQLDVTRIDGGRAGEHSTVEYEAHPDQRAEKVAVPTLTLTT